MTEKFVSIKKDWFTVISSDIKDNPKSPKLFSFDICEITPISLCFKAKALRVSFSALSPAFAAPCAKTLH